MGERVLRIYLDGVLVGRAGPDKESVDRLIAKMIDQGADIDHSLTVATKTVVRLWTYDGPEWMKPLGEAI